MLVALILMFAPKLIGTQVSNPIEVLLNSELIPWDQIEQVYGAVCVATAALIGVSWYSFKLTGRRKWVRRHTAAVMMSAVLLIVAAVILQPELDEITRMAWWYLALLPWLASISTRSSVSLVRLTVRRREFTPHNQRILLRAKDQTADRNIKW